MIKLFLVIAHPKKRRKKGCIMKVTVFAKNRKTAQGNKFVTYLAQLKRKDGTTETVAVKFAEACGAPKPDECPAELEIARDKMNLATRKYTDEEGLQHTGYTLWVNEWSVAGPYVDHSLDDFE